MSLPWVLRSICILFVVNSLLVAAARAQVTASTLPEAPSQSQPNAQASASLSGVVLDPDGSGIAGARITVEEAATKITHTVATDSNGVFSFAALVPGQFALTVVSDGFARWTSSSILLTPDEDYDLPDITLQIAEAMTEVDVVFTPYELAQEQIHEQEQQRIFGIFPNFYATYEWHATPMTPGQKFKLALRASSDPGFFLQNAAVAGIQQWQNDFPGYGQGTVGYFKRFGAVSADGFVTGILGGALLPSILHQDPRYFYLGRGTILHRALYAIATVAITKGDNGRWQPNYSNILGNLASAGLSNVYYPASDRKGASVTIDNALIGTAEGAFSSLMQEFILRKFTPHKKP